MFFSCSFRSLKNFEKYVKTIIASERSSLLITKQIYAVYQTHSQPKIKPFTIEHNILIYNGWYLVIVQYKFIAASSSILTTVENSKKTFLETRWLYTLEIKIKNQK